MSKFGSSMAGQPPEKAKVRIVLIQTLDAAGKPIPGEFKYGVMTFGIPPVILDEFDTYAAAVDFAIKEGYAIDDIPQP